MLTRPKLADVLAALPTCRLGNQFWITQYPDGWAAGIEPPWEPGIATVSLEMGRDRRKSVKKALDLLESEVKLKQKKGKRSGKTSKAESPQPTYSPG